MENGNRSSYVENGEIKKLPIGFRFRPTDEELVVHYLKRKALCFPLPASIIPEFDVFHTHPSILPGDLKENRHFFTKRNVDGNRYICGSAGYWKESGKKKQIVASQINHVLGMKRSLVFYQAATSPHHHVSKTSWVMHEYSLLHFTPKLYVMGLEDWVVCKVFEKKNRMGRKKCNISRSIKDTNQEIKQCCIDVIVEEICEVGPPQLSSSQEISPFGTTDQEESSGYIFSPQSS